MPRACVIVLDAVGAGALPDADQFGDEHVRTGKWILYTSADSVFQIAAHPRAR